MRTFATLIALLALSACEPAASEDAPATVAGPAAAVDMEDEAQKTSYALGADIGNKFNSQEIEVDLDAMIAGLRDGYGGEMKMSEEDIATTLRAFGAAQREAQMARRASQGEANEAEGAAFLATNAERPEVSVTESGLQYEVLTEGDGATPTATDRVTVHYKGTLIDGTEFDSSYGRGEPTSFRVNGVIRGWTEALQMMQVGDKYKLYIPGDLAYGPRGSGDKIGPNAVLVFEVELLAVES